MPDLSSQPLTVLGIAFSPRKGGNSELLLDECLRGAVSGGAAVEKVCARDLHIRPCAECGGCIDHPTCVINDDMQPLYPKLLGCDRLVISSPVFFASLPATGKAVIDRCQALWSKKVIRKEKLLTRDFPNGRLGAFLLVGGMNRDKQLEYARAPIKDLFLLLGITFASELYFKQIDHKGGILKHPTAMADAFALGQRLGKRE